MFVNRISFVISMLTALTQAAPIEILGDEQIVPDTNTPIPILSQTDEISPDGSFSYSFETANHIKQQANGYHKTVLVPRLRSDGTQTGELESADIIVQTGSYSYLAPDGTLISVQFVADENGFQAFGGHLPTPPSAVQLPESIMHEQSSQQLTEEQPPTTNQLIATQDNAIAVPSESTIIQNNESQQRQQRSSFFPPLFQ
ncbi:endocuticle structural glycoprotein SgAbd-2-like [Contarinia nasturtii]|uniref:endocuticle structural glycoprotein SgAbd-2-like n=1 Tax=Contarinia nasturtii TaxID=265458 RepID=UPI0012D3BD39|nr:endocuticle structural glycoprotein SgAbd-2-like [Contarinia nasturtii]